MSDFHVRLKILKDETEKTQAQIAEAIGITPQALSYYFNGREPNYDILIKIANYFEVSTDYLLGISDYKSIKNENIAKKFCLSEAAINKMELLTRLASKDNGVLLSDVLNALLVNENIVDLLRVTLNYLLSFNDDDFGKYNDKIKEMAQEEKDDANFLKGAGANYVSTKFASILVDIMNKGEIETYYDIKKTKDGWVASSKDKSQ